MPVFEYRLFKWKHAFICLRNESPFGSAQHVKPGGRARACTPFFIVAQSLEISLIGRVVVFNNRAKIKVRTR